MNNWSGIWDKILFQSAPLTRGETVRLEYDRRTKEISIHSPHARGDPASTGIFPALTISTHSPHARGDFVKSVGYESAVISIHSPHARGDDFARAAYGRLYDFNPLPSCEGRQHKPPKIRPDLCQLTQQNHDTPLFGALQAPFCGAKPDIRGAKPTGKP